MDEPSRGPGALRARRIYFGGRARGETNAAAVESRKTANRGKDTSDGTTTLEADEILLQLNGDPCESGGPTSNESLSRDGTMCNNAIHPRLEESDAKRQIELIFRTPACWRSETDQTHLLYLLQRFPALASHNFDWDYNLFWQHGSEWSTPLCFLLASGANLDTIQAVYALHPEAIWKPQGVHRDLPLHFACRFGVPEECLLFLIRKFPHAVMVSNSSGMLPIHCALGKKDVFPYGTFNHASLETIKILLDLYPQSLMKEEHESRNTPLQIAFAHAYSFEVIDLIINRMPERLDSFDLKAGCYHSKRFRLDFGIAESVLASKLLPRLQRFHCQPTEWKMEGLVQLLRCMQQNCSVLHFTVKNLPGGFLLDEALVNAMSDLLQCNSTLETLGLSLSSDGENDDKCAFFQYLDKNLQKNRTLQALELENFSVGCEGLNAFLTSGQSLRTVTMTNFVLLQGESLGAKSIDPASTNKLRKVVMSNCTVMETAEVEKEKPFLSLLHGLATLTRLRDLTLDIRYQTRQQKAEDITAPIVHLLKSRSLECLRVRGTSAQVRPVCEALRSNLALSRLDFPSLLDTKENRALMADTLENHNSTIELVQLPGGIKKHCDEMETKKIRYLTRLNQYGRAYLRESNTAKSLVVRIIQHSASTTCQFEPEEALSILYGLLRESPSLWCNTARYGGKGYDCQGRERKRQRICSSA